MNKLQPLMTIIDFRGGKKPFHSCLLWSSKKKPVDVVDGSKYLGATIDDKLSSGYLSVRLYRKLCGFNVDPKKKK